MQWRHFSFSLNQHVKILNTSLSSYKLLCSCFFIVKNCSFTCCFVTKFQNTFWHGSDQVVILVALDKNNNSAFDCTFCKAFHVIQTCSINRHISASQNFKKYFLVRFWFRTCSQLPDFNVVHRGTCCLKWLTIFAQTSIDEP